MAIAHCSKSSGKGQRHRKIRKKDAILIWSSALGKTFLTEEQCYSIRASVKKYIIIELVTERDTQNPGFGLTFFKVERAE